MAAGLVLTDLIAQPFQIAVQNVKQQRLFAIVIVIDIGLRDPTFPRQHRHRGPIITQLGKNLGRLAQDLTPFLVIVFGNGSGQISPLIPVINHAPGLALTALNRAGLA